jgi:squalene-hopene/tetraprenyl-beta-curcumene cyclase
VTVVSQRPAGGGRHPDAAGVDAALARACEALRRLQHSHGWWKGELETNVTIDAEDLLLRSFLGVLTPSQAAGTARWIRSKQRSDGTWATFYEGPPDLSTTVEAWAALRLAGDRADAAHMRKAAEFVLDAGGVEASRVFTRVWMALFGLWPWEQLPVIPPELVLLPARVPLNIYDFGCWARQTIVPLAIVGSYRPVRALPFGIDELRTGAAVARPAPFPSWKWAFAQADRALHGYERRPLRALRRLALARAEQWIVQRQEADGGWGGIQPPWVYSLIALQLRGYPLDHPVMRAGIAGFDGFTVEDHEGRRLEACQSPVWDTALAVTALADAGAGADDPAVLSAAAWLLGEEVRGRGDWAVRRPNLAPGGWAFEFANVNYPDIDDTAEVGLALLRAGAGSSAAVARGRDWVLGMQSRDGGWGAFDADNTRALCRELPFCDFGELIDPPSADVTAHVVEFLAAVDGPRAAIDAGADWLLRAQERDGSWFGRWGANHVYGTGAVVPALVAAGVPGSSRPVQRAVEWLHRQQNDDGGWGEDLRSYRDDRWRGRGASTASQTAWALLALLAAGDASQAVARGVAWLVTAQRPDGTWDEPWFTGTGFPGDFYINYHLYRLVFPVVALGRYARMRHG